MTFILDLECQDKPACQILRQRSLRSNVIVQTHRHTHLADCSIRTTM